MMYKTKSQPIERDPVVGVDQVVAVRRDRVRVAQAWHSVTDLDAGHKVGSVFDVCPACWPAHTRIAHGRRRVRVNPPIVTVVRCHWCDARRVV